MLKRSVPPHAALYKGRHVPNFVLDLVYQLENGGGMTSRIASQRVRSTDPAPIKLRITPIDGGGGGVEGDTLGAGGGWGGGG